MNINSSTLILLQLFLDIILIGLFLLLYIKLKSLTLDRIDSFIQALRESEDLTKRLNKLIEEKKILVRKLEAVLDKEESNACADENDPTIQAEQLIRSKVISLWEKGKSYKEISKETGLPLGEIEVIISLFKSKL